MLTRKQVTHGRSVAEQQFGMVGELWAKAQLEARGYKVQHLDDFQAPFDLLVNDRLPVEVKIAHKRRYYVRKGYYRPAWEFKIRGGLDAREVDHVVIAICDTAQGYIPFIIPGAWLVGKIYLRITSSPDVYAGYVSAGCRNWGLVDEVLAQVDSYSHNIALPRNDLFHCSP